MDGRYEWELAEVEEEIRAAEEAMEPDFSSSRRGGSDDGGGDGDESTSDSRAAATVNSPAAVAARMRVQDELGDLLFDVLMLGAMCERSFGSGRGDVAVAVGTGVSLAGAAAGAAAKVKRRCPYTFGPLRGPCPSRLDEEREWKAAKALEKAAVREGGAPPPPPPPTRSPFSKTLKKNLFSIFSGAHGGAEDVADHLLAGGAGSVAAAAMLALGLGFALGLAVAGRRR